MNVFSSNGWFCWGVWVATGVFGGVGGVVLWVGVCSDVLVCIPGVVSKLLRFWFGCVVFILLALWVNGHSLALAVLCRFWCCVPFSI